MPTTPWLVAGGVTLRDQLNKRCPKRDKASDGWLGDAAHASRFSYHNPDEKKAVHATDFDEDFGHKGDSMIFANQLLDYCKQGRKGSERILHIVYEDRVASATYANAFWVWRGSGYGHTAHIHISYSEVGEKNGAKFDIPFLMRYEWDGIIPSLASIQKSRTDDLRNKAAFRLANRLFDKGYYDNEVRPLGVQGYPVNAVMAWQADNGYETNGRISGKQQYALFDAVRP